MNNISKKPLTALLGLAFYMLIHLCLAADLAYADDALTAFNISATNNLSFYFQNIEVRTLLQLIAKSSGINFIISDAVKGSMSLNLKGVSWQEALDVILKSQGLSSQHIGNVVYISTIEEFASNETKRMRTQQDLLNLAPLTSKLIHLKYTNATDMATLLKGQQSQLITPRGQIAVDSRTNSLIIRDTKENLADVVPEILKLDVPARQVLIEARIVNIDVIYEEQLGVRFGTSNTRHLSGTFNGANNLTQGVNLPFVTNPAGTIDPTQRLNFNIPAAQLFDGTNPGSIAVALAHIGPALLDLELSALEGESHAQIIARPRVITSNQQKAMIQTGEEIPYQEATSSGATSITFKNAVLSLEIVPQITPDNKIILNLKATEDTKGENINVGTAGTTTSTVPAINTQEVQSNVLLNNNETIVLGGVYRVLKNNSVDRIPFFGDIPLVGALFRHTSEQNEKHELLIFITPKIIVPGENKPIKSANNSLSHRLYKGETQ